MAVEVDDVAPDRRTAGPVPQARDQGENLRALADRPV
jgi:hypothetical protein